MYEPLLSAFLAQADVPRLSWIQDVSCARYSSASAALLEEATRETRLAEQKLLLSLGKLAKVADLTRDQLASSEGTQREIDAVDERLDVTATHERLIELCRVTLDARDLAKPVEAQAKECVARLCGNQSEPMQSVSAALASRTSLHELIVGMCSARTGSLCGPAERKSALAGGPRRFALTEGQRQSRAARRLQQCRRAADEGQADAPSPA